MGINFTFMAFRFHKKDPTRTYHNMIYVKSIKSNVMKDLIAVREIHEPFSNLFFSTGSTIGILGSLLYIKRFTFYAISNKFNCNNNKYRDRKPKFDHDVKIGE